MDTVRKSEMPYLRRIAPMLLDKPSGINFITAMQYRTDFTHIV
jgi:hypothetical protein